MSRIRLCEAIQLADEDEVACPHPATVRIGDFDLCPGCADVSADHGASVHAHKGEAGAPVQRSNAVSTRSARSTSSGRSRRNARITLRTRGSIAVSASLRVSASRLAPRACAIR